MSRLALALTAAALIGAAAPATAFSLSANLPNLTYPEKPAPDASKGCANLTSLSGETCTIPVK